MNNKERVDVVVVVPLEEELHEVMSVFVGTEDRSTDTQFRYLVDSGSPEIRVLIVQQEGMGKSHAARAVATTLDDFDASLIVCVGIAGALGGDLRLGDVCYSEGIIDVYDNSKAHDSTAGGLDIALSPEFFQSPREVSAAFNFIRTLPDLKAAYTSWQEAQESEAKDLLKVEIVGRAGIPEGIGRPISKNGTIVCGAVSKSDHYNEKLKSIDRKILAIETESGGIFEEARRRGVASIAIRGISDYADAAKNLLERHSGGAVRKIAARNAATFLKLQLNNTPVRKLLTRLRQSSQLSLSLPGVTLETKSFDLGRTVAEIEASINERLRELCPEYKLQEKGYKLPVPRMRRIEFANGTHEAFTSVPVEIREALETHNVILLSLSRNYPDYSIPWVLANDLLGAEISNQQILPIVVDGSSMAPPARGLDACAQYRVDDVSAIGGLQRVFIIDEIPLGSKTKTAFIESEIRKHPTAKFVVITRNQTHIIAESEFARVVSAEIFQLSSVSFLEIAYFIQKNFGMTGAESEVIALRLTETFRSFDLSAHPTYFAGMSKEILSALLQANRRAELIQLAVDGFLTFVVAGDKATVKLSRTTRARFLRKLAFELNVEKNQFDQAALMTLATEFSGRHDFDIDPLGFISSFVDSGILHFVDGRVRFALPFIESYLLAAELSDNPEQAKRYFDYGGRDFDLNTFDLYSEIGASNASVDRLFGCLETSISEFKLGLGTNHILLSDTLRPTMLGKPGRLEALQRRLHKTAEDVHLGRGDLKRKQRILDVIDRVQEAAAQRSKLSNSEGAEETETEEQQKVNVAIQSWVISTTLLGAGAEHLTAEVKQNLARLIIELGAIIIHRWTEAHAKVDFSELKVEIISGTDLNSFRAESSQGDTETSEEEMRTQIEGIIDVLEWAFLSEPVRRVLHHLCENARQKVLATSIERASVNGAVESLIHTTWLTDVESKRGKKPLIHAIKALPPSVFLRTALATHFLSRTQWSHSSPDDRLSLLDAADEAVRPFFTIAKGQIKRKITKKPRGRPKKG